MEDCIFTNVLKLLPVGNYLFTNVLKLLPMGNYLFTNVDRNDQHIETYFTNEYPTDTPILCVSS